MLLELCEVAAGLPFASRITGALPYDRSVVGQEAILYHAFVYLRAKTQASPTWIEAVLSSLHGSSCDIEPIALKCGSQLVEPVQCEPVISRATSERER